MLWLINQSIKKFCYCRGAFLKLSKLFFLNNLWLKRIELEKKEAMMLLIRQYFLARTS